MESFRAITIRAASGHRERQRVVSRDHDQGNLQGMFTKTPHAKKTKALAISGVVMVVLAVPGRSAQATAAPPELAPLVAKMSELHVSSARLAGEVTVTGHKLPRKLKALGGLKLKLSGELSTFPPAASITAASPEATISVRLVNKRLYIEEPALAKLDGGRPWIEESPQSTKKLFGASPGLGANSGLGGPEGSLGQFKSDAALLNKATNVRSLGQSTIDGQAVTGFAGTIAATQFEEGQFPSKLRGELRRLHLNPKGSFEIFIAANGLPVRTSLGLAFRGVKIQATVDVPAIDFPVGAVPVPPASETITAAELEKLLRHRGARRR
jgi:hypothetical protein